MRPGRRGRFVVGTASIAVCCIPVSAVVHVPLPRFARMSSPYTEEQGPAGLTPAVLWLLVANVAVFFLQQTVVKAEDLQAVFAFDGADLLRRWWTPLTYAFLHGDIWHIAFQHDRAVAVRSARGEAVRAPRGSCASTCGAHWVAWRFTTSCSGGSSRGRWGR